MNESGVARSRTRRNVTMNNVHSLGGAQIVSHCSRKGENHPKYSVTLSIVAKCAHQCARHKEGSPWVNCELLDTASLISQTSESGHLKCD